MCERILRVSALFFSDINSRRWIPEVSGKKSEDLCVCGKKWVNRTNKSSGTKFFFFFCFTNVMMSIKFFYKLKVLYKFCHLMRVNIYKLIMYNTAGTFIIFIIKVLEITKLQ